MIILEDKRNCVGCANCVQICPQKCLSFSQDKEGFFYPAVDVSRCINCGRCNEVCPVGTERPHADDLPKMLVMGAYHKDENIRNTSSSGGLFMAFALETLKRNGSVYGAAMTENRQVRHMAIRTPDGLSQLQGSKYVQSDIMGVFPAIEATLKDGTPLLFSGTPCQVKALYCFLGTHPDNLLTIDVVCHGVPSPLLFERYLCEEKASRMVFRNKERSWRNYNVELHLSSGRTRQQRAAFNPYMRGFLHNWILRPSCSQCPAKSFSSGSDITLGDFWGVEHFAPELYDDKGTSAVFIHSKSGEKAWRDIQKNIAFAEVPFDNVLAENPSIIQSAPFPKDRARFFEDLDHTSLKTTLKKYTGEKPLSIAKRYLLGIWNLGWNKALALRNALAVCSDKVYQIFLAPPTIIGIEETLQQIISNGYSVSRFGEGELQFILGKKTLFQEADPLIQKRLKEILQKRQGKLLVCLPNVFGSLSVYTKLAGDYWKRHLARYRKSWYRQIDRHWIYYDAFICRCYLQYKDKHSVARVFKLWQQLWEGRDLLIIEGEKTRMGVGNDLFANAKSIKRILCSNTQAFSHYNELLMAAQRFDRKHLILIALGVTSTILAADLCSKKYQAIDIGLLDIEYEWYLRNADGKIPIPGKFVNEAGAGKGVGDIDDQQYLNEIVCRC